MAAILSPERPVARKRFVHDEYVELTMHFRCNLKCVHCMIEDTMDWLKPESMQKFEEILAFNIDNARWKGRVTKVRTSTDGKEFYLRYLCCLLFKILMP